MKQELRSIQTGYVVTTIELDDDGKEFIEEYAYEDLADALSFMKCNLEPGSRHDASRIYVIRAPGDKNGNFKDYHSKAIWGDDDGN